MFRYVLTFWLAVATGSSFHIPQEDIAEVLARSEVLYYEARFRESIELLSDLDDSLEAESDHSLERANLKLQLALGHLALNNLARAKTSFMEMCALDPNCALEAQKYPPKVLSLFEEAKSEYAKDAAEQYFQQGLESYKSDDLPEALRKFSEAVRRNSEHVIATQYQALARERLRLAIDQQLLEWRRRLESGEVELAAAAYRRVEALNAEGMADADINQIRSQPPRPTPTPVSPPPPKSCIRENVQTAMLRVKTSAKPVISATLEASLRNTADRTVRIEARIDESGDVTVLSARGDSLPATDAVRTAVRKWKFFPAIIDSQPRCVETVFPIVVGTTGPK